MRRSYLWVFGVVLVVLVFRGIYFFYVSEGYVIKSFPAYIDVNPVEALEIISQNSGMTIIDVSQNYAMGHIPGAVNYYVGDGSLDNTIPNLNKSVAYLIYCHSESASRLGAQKLIDAGFENIYRLKGEYGAWVFEDYRVDY